jgi:hypothetical protein
MKTIKLTALIFYLVLASYSCKDKIQDTYMVNEPIYLSYADLRSSFHVKSADEIIQPGKIYYKDHFIYVNEYQKGIHVIDNTNPSDPQNLKFIEIPGNVDLAIKDSILYADSYVDLLAIDISNLNDIKEVTRIENAFPYMIPDYTVGVVGNVDSQKGIVTGYQLVEKTEKVDPANNQWNRYPYWSEDKMFVSNMPGNAVSNANNVGVAGSMARFALYQNFLYAVENSSLKLFDITTPATPVAKTDIYVGWNIETIFPYNDKLFIGSGTGLYIYGLNDPSNPSLISQFRHASSCDPVVVKGDYAYVTLRSGNLCGDAASQLDVIDLTNIEFPVLLKDYPMEEPYGLGIDDSLLFVCDGSAGLKIYNSSDPQAIDSNQIATYPDVNAFDVIPLGEVLLMAGKDGLYQYNYSDPKNITLLSFIPIKQIKVVKKIAD